MWWNHVVCILTYIWDQNKYRLQSSDAWIFHGSIIHLQLPKNVSCVTWTPKPEDNLQLCLFSKIVFLHFIHFSAANEGVYPTKNELAHEEKQIM